MSVGVIPPHMISTVRVKNSHSRFEVPKDKWLIQDWQEIGLIPESALPPIDIGAFKKRAQVTKSLPGLSRSVYSAEYASALPGKLIREEGGKTVQDPAVNEAYDHIGDFYEFLKVAFDRNSIDNKGMRIIATVHFQKGYDNAFWNGQQVVFGDGDDNLPPPDRLFNRFTKSLSIASHELFHGVIQYEAALVYSNQPGALLSSFSNIFGELTKQFKHRQSVKEASWVVGEGLFTPNIKGKGIVSLKTPGSAYDDPLLGKDPQPAHMKDYVNTVSDNGGVHINSGIPNHAFYVSALEIGGFAWEKTGTIWYDTLCNHLKSNSTFSDAAQNTYKAAGEKFGKGGLEQKAVKLGWSEVGINAN